MDGNPYRTMEILHWIRALNDGYGRPRNGSVQPAFVSNITYYMLDAGVRKSFYQDKWRDAYYGSSFDQKVYDHMHNHIATCLYQSGGSLTRADKLKKSPENTASLREGYDSLECASRVYELTHKGELWADKNLEDALDLASKYNHAANTEKILIPVEGRHGWDTTIHTLPRVNRYGRCMDTDVLLESRG